VRLRYTTFKEGKKHEPTHCTTCLLLTGQSVLSFALISLISLFLLAIRGRFRRGVRSDT
jgi:hypothetical protein